ncbi:uncharacterized protein L969DRAFT_69315 [Mixia osmundae IAM 14324]|uniref:S-formylglutathione hydrolase n=1 Tax=Mixia osmundae (strain CBS 9802 / IAM 14324 / JCM 22182 / KY 12970) TaxID=764103 RepID=G7EAI7_MIXOS|nr:uncharacterized protein L969DRAFT_69315 [Mixia osmundae IAM 14324]KEI42337.1 hypothetical protein L969DRAFT_69315 [Mixia osmundae IAM 14324]GAA99847.1 hypothetical protein E5Q_06550 [Mixia osmundae IAM 14324]
MGLKQESANKTFGGTLTKYELTADKLGQLTTKINVFVPGGSGKFPVLLYLAGLTCTEDNGAQKGGFFQSAAEHKIALVFPDTSPRGAKIESEDDSFDFGSGAGFYLDATKEPWSKHYNMSSYLTEELPALLKEADLPLDLSRTSLMGHSMGGHGAISLYLRHPQLYKSASGFSPIANPTQCGWGEKAFKGYLKGGVEEGKKYDSTELIAGFRGKDVHILIDQGTGDDWYKKGQLLTENFQKAAGQAGLNEESVKIRMQDGYDHSYFFISTFASDHVAFHAKYLHA